MFFRKRRVMDIPKSEADDAFYWNGWTKGLIERVNGTDSFDIVFSKLLVTDSFNGKRYAAAVRIAESEMEQYCKMALLFDEKPSGRPDRGYSERTVEAEGQDHLFGLHSIVEIFVATPGQVIETASSGVVRLDAADLTSDRREGRRFRTPCLLVSLNDVDGHFTDSLRRAFQAAKLCGSPPSMRLLLAAPINLSLETFENGDASRRAMIESAIVWESWTTKQPP